MKVTVKETVSKEVELTLPCYFKKKDTGSVTTMLAFFSEEHAFRVQLFGDGQSSMQNWKARDFSNIDVVNDYEPITEVEYFDFHQEVLNSLSLTPVLVEDEDINTATVNQ